MKWARHNEYVKNTQYSAVVELLRLMFHRKTDEVDWDRLGTLWKTATANRRFVKSFENKIGLASMGIA